MASIARWLENPTSKPAAESSNPTCLIENPEGVQKGCGSKSFYMDQSPTLHFDGQGSFQK